MPPNKGASLLYLATQIAMIKVAAPRAACRIVDQAIQVCGAAGVSQDYPLANM